MKRTCGTCPMFQPLTSAYPYSCVWFCHTVISTTPECEFRALIEATPEMRRLRRIERLAREMVRKKCAWGEGRLSCEEYYKTLDAFEQAVTPRRGERKRNG